MTTKIRKSWTERPTDSHVGMRVVVKSWGLGARLMDVGRTGTITKINRTRVEVTFDAPLDGESVRVIDGDCLRPLG